MKRKLAAVVLVTAVATLIGGCFSPPPNRPFSRVVVKSIEQIDDYWRVTIANKGNTITWIRLSSFKAYSNGEEVARSYTNPTGGSHRGAPFYGLRTLCGKDGECTHSLWDGKEAWVDVFHGVDNIDEINAWVVWGAGGLNTINQTYSVPYP